MPLLEVRGLAMHFPVSEGIVLSRKGVRNAATQRELVRHLDADGSPAHDQQAARHRLHRGRLATRPDALQVAQPGHGRGGHVRDLVRHRDQRHVLALAELGAGLLAFCVILLAAILFFSLAFLFPRDAPMRARSLLLLALTVIAALSIYVLMTTRMR